MKKLLALTVLIALFSYGAESFRVLREVPEPEEEPGPLSTVTNTLWSFVEKSVDTANGWLESLKNLKLDEKAKNMFDETTKAVSTYSSIMQDQVYFLLYSESK
ncbi:apolipoprotein C-II-like [Scleropages formosus]|uniref:Apolipoprotein C-II n=1 Tax=Scleropages formosus TaxID=113540 RepID=A0A0P7TZ82_SCLFO|nr:apolipoprotein C-II-like [Scleropages formosus]XP_018587700.1 apolipoprotein C-II-like [Scleropages formosus]KPP59429.1 apolipoprotein C-II-like [Scleropages formosus]